MGSCENEQGSVMKSPACGVKLHSQTPLHRQPTMEKLVGLNRTRKLSCNETLMNLVQNVTAMSSSPNDKAECIVRSGDGQQVYYFGLIDVLVGYNWYAKTQYWGT